MSSAWDPSAAVRRPSRRPARRPANAGRAPARFLIAALASVGFGFQPGPAGSQSASQIPEQSVKAAYLYKFASYVDWPETAALRDGGPIEIGVVGAPVLADELAQVTAGRTVNNHPISVRQIAQGDGLDGIHILFVGDEGRQQLGEILAPARLRPILTVTESDGALEHGSVINFTINDQRVRFEVALYAAEQNRLRLSSRLLAVAQHVYLAPE